jgi:hypothetical protein
MLSANDLAYGGNMTITLNQGSFAFAQEQIRAGKVVLDQRTDWSEHQLSTGQENEFLQTHGWDEYAHWHLGVDDEASEDTQARYTFPDGDFARVHRCGCSPLRYGPGNTSTWTSRRRPSGCAMMDERDH